MMRSAEDITKHPDDLAVDRFASAMSVKLEKARAKGRSGWDDRSLCSADFLADLLVGHVGKTNAGNLEDIANLAMMLHQRGDDPAVVATALHSLIAEHVDAALGHVESLVESEALLADALSSARRQAEGES